MRSFMSVVVLALAACLPEKGLVLDPNAVGISTDSAVYTAVPIGYGQVVVRVITTFRNPTLGPVMLDRCTSAATSPIYDVAVTWPVSKAGAGYAPIWACVGNDHPIVVEGGATRTDTIVLRGPNLFDNASQTYLGVIAGRFRIGYGGAGSNEFEIRIPEGGVVPNVVRDLGPAIQTDSLIYHLHSAFTSYGYYYDHGNVPVRATIFNPLPDTSFIVTCNGQSATYLERLDNGIWSPAWSDAVPACLGPVIAIPPNGQAQTAVSVNGGGKGSRILPQYTVPYVPGVYRLVWREIVKGFAMGPPTNLGTPIPIEYRRSNPFALVVEP